MEKQNNKKALVSVIMPAYNAEKTIARAIHSVLQQDYSNIELIVINDGSKDGTEIVSRSILDNRLKIVDQQNLGLSGARNTGLSHAKGDFIVFVDSDDWVELNYLSLLYESLVENNASLSICGMIRDYPDNRQQRISFKSSSSYSDCLKNESFLSLFEGGLINSCCNKIYRRSVIENNQLSFSGKILVEDIEFNLNYLRFSGIINTITDCPYHYVVNDLSLTSKVSEEMFVNYIDIHSSFISLVPRSYKYMIDRFVYHQYINLFFKYIQNVSSGKMLKKDVYPIIRYFLKEQLIKDSFCSFTPMGIKNTIMHKCVQKGLFDVIIIYYRYYRKS